MDRALDLFMPGFQKPLSEWSLRALEGMRVDLFEQRGAARSPQEREDIDARLLILYGEAKRRDAGVEPRLAAELKSKGATKSFAAREENETQLALPLEGGRDRSRDSSVEIDRRAGLER